MRDINKILLYFIKFVLSCLDVPARVAFIFNFLNLIYSNIYTIPEVKNNNYLRPLKWYEVTH